MTARCFLPSLLLLYTLSTSDAFTPSSRYHLPIVHSITKSQHRKASSSSCTTTTTNLFSSNNNDDKDNTTTSKQETIQDIQLQLPLPNPFTKHERPQDITTESFGPLLPIAKAVDDATGGWGLSYADLHPATPKTSVGQAFLATNFCYAAGGLALGVQGEWFLGALTELAGIVSFWYHYSQLEFGKNRAEVRLALLIDYFTAGSALITGGIYMIQQGIDTVPLDAILAAGASIICLTLCWVWEFGYPYIFWHSLWHILSALTGYLVGREHIANVM